MTKTDYTHITFVGDRSGSMGPTRHAATSGFAEFLKGQRELPGSLEGGLTVSLYDFDGIIQERAWMAHPNSIYWTCQPRGNTALYDAIGIAMKRTGEALAAMPEEARPSKVFVVIITDGQENASREYTGAMVAEMIKTQREQYGWEIIFIGAGEDKAVRAVANFLNIDRERTMSYSGSSVGTSNIYSALNSSVLRSRSGGSADFTEAERESAQS